MSAPGPSALAQTIIETLRGTAKQFAEVVDDHPDVAWRDLLRAWGEVREADVLKRDDLGRYYVAGGAAERQVTAHAGQGGA